MRGKCSQVLFAAALFPANAPLAKRVETLNKYFDPKPGSFSEIDAATIRDRMVSAKSLGKFGGSINVKPPKGTCFSIKRSSERPNIKICRETPVHWALDDVNLETGTVEWVIQTGPEDFGTPVSWKVPYVIAKVLPPEAEFFKENSTPIYFKSCIASHGDSKLNPRKITLTKFDNTKWVIRFPEKDNPIGSINQSRPGEVWGENYKPKKDDSKKADEVTPSESKAESNVTAPAEQAAATDVPPKDDMEPWTIDAGRTFEMSVENFISDISMPPGRKGDCRYVFDHIPGNLERGRIECHDTGQYRYVYAFLPCMGALAPSDLKATPKKTGAK